MTVNLLRTTLEVLMEWWSSQFREMDGKLAGRKGAEVSVGVVRDTR